MTFRSRTDTAVVSRGRRRSGRRVGPSGEPAHRGVPRVAARPGGGLRVGTRAVLVGLVAFGLGAGAGVGATSADGPDPVARWWGIATGRSAAKDVAATDAALPTDEVAQRRSGLVSRAASPNLVDGLPWSVDGGFRVSPVAPIGTAVSAPELEPEAETVPQMVPAELPPLTQGLLVSDATAGLLSLEVPESASGELVVVPGAQPAPGTGPVTTIRVEVEAGLEVDPGLFALTVMTTLNDARGWGADGSITFARTDGDADLRVVLASPQLVDELCAPLETQGTVSCGTNGHAVLNLRRWIEGANGWDGDKVSYRQYLVNHEVGHLLGHRHVLCAGAGQRADLMQQQSGSVAPCLPNPWPFPSP